MESRIIKLNCAISRRARQLMQRLPDLSGFSEYCRVIRSLNSSGPRRRLRSANGTMLQAMNESFPQWPGLLCKFVLPSGPKYFLLNLWITDSQATTPIGMLPTAGFRLAVQFYSDSASEGNRREGTSIAQSRTGHGVSAISEVRANGLAHRAISARRGMQMIAAVIRRQQATPLTSTLPRNALLTGVRAKDRCK